MNNLIVNKSQTVKAKITKTPAFGLIFKFEQIPNISFNNIEVYGMEAYTADQLAIAPSGENVIPAAALNSMTVTLVTKGINQRIYNMPYIDFVRSSNGGFVTILNRLKLSITECYITITDPTNLALDQVAFFNIYYREL